MIRVGIIGISGYSGREVFEICRKHPDVRVSYVSARKNTGPLEDVWPDLKSRSKLTVEPFKVSEAAKRCDCVFLALPHKESMKITPKLLKAGLKVIDLSGDYRLKKPSLYPEWYGFKHADPYYLSRSVYGLPEYFRQEIKEAKLIANPGCYPTAALLALGPLTATHTKSINSIIIDAKSGVSGAGRKVTEQLMSMSVNENFKAYKVLSHQHTPEINQYLSRIADQSFDATFTAHLLPIRRGIQETIYVSMSRKISVEKLYTLYQKFYKTEKFVRVLKPGKQPEINDVVRSNFCDIGLAVDEKKKMVVITSVIDNLVKGAAGQAVQNMNIMYGFKEVEGLL